MTSFQINSSKGIIYGYLEDTIYLLSAVVKIDQMVNENRTENLVTK